jgi:hypothetical protein
MMSTALISSLACATLTNIISPPTSTPEPTATLPPSPTPAPTATVAPTQEEGSSSGDILFEDDFSDSDSGWDQAAFDNGSTDYYEGGYRIELTVDFWFAWANPGLSFDDVHVEVDATLIGGSENNEYGVICRYRNTDNFYAGVISSDGFYAIRKVYRGDVDLLGSDSFRRSSRINLGPDVTNRIRFDCAGETIALYVNGQLLDEVEDGDIAFGDVGLLAGTFDDPQTEILFDDLVVYLP